VNGPAWLDPPVGWASALAAGAVAAFAYTGVVVAYSLHPATNVSVGQPLWKSVAAAAGLSLGTVGVPVALWARARLRGPLALAGLVLLFWHLIVEVTLFGGGRGDSPGFLFAFVLAPGYVVAYVVLAGVEYWVRTGRLPVVK